MKRIAGGKAHKGAVSYLKRRLTIFERRDLEPSDLEQAISMVHSAIGLVEQCRCAGHAPKLYIVSPDHRTIVTAGVISRTSTQPLASLRDRVARSSEISSMYNVELDPLTKRALGQFHRAARVYGAGIVSILAPVGPVSRFEVHMEGGLVPGADPVKILQNAIRSH